MKILQVIIRLLLKNNLQSQIKNVSYWSFYKYALISASKFLEDIEKNQLWVCQVSTPHVIPSRGNPDRTNIAGVCAITCDQSPEYADCGWDLSEDAAVPHRLAIHPDYQRLGIAKSFLQKAEGLKDIINIYV